MVRAWTASLTGVVGIPVEVEVRLSSQLPRVDVVGLPEAAVRESTSRIRGAIAAAGLSFPDRRVTVNLAPAELRKQGAGLDLPIAVAILAATGDALDPERLERRGFVGELALDGRLRSTRGTLAAVLALRDLGVDEVVVPEDSLAFAGHAPGIRVLGADTLGAVLDHLMGREPLSGTHDLPANDDASSRADALCLSDVRGQSLAKRALEIAAAGGHGLLLRGPPGTGKSMLARRLPGILPPLDDEARLEVFCILDAEGLANASDPLPYRPPFRAPHHSASAAGLLGGGHPIRSGEVTLAHRGLLFLDELPEFDRRCLESLREVLELGLVRIARANTRCELPARFQLVAAANPCPCGYHGTRDRDCRCDDAALARYARRLSGPLLDRIDLSVQVGEIDWATFRPDRSDGDGDEAPRVETSHEVRARVESARGRQQARGVRCNADLPDRGLEDVVALEPDAERLLDRAAEHLKLSMRAVARSIRVARTIADLADRSTTDRSAMAEALSLRTAHE